MLHTTSSNTCNRHSSYANRVSEGYLEIREVVTKEVAVIEVLSANHAALGRKLMRRSVEKSWVAELIWSKLTCCGVENLCQLGVSALQDFS